MLLFIKMALFMSYPILYVFEYQAQKFVMHGHFVCVYWSEILYAFLYLPPIHEYRYARYVYMNLDVEFKKRSKIAFYEILIMIGINFTRNIIVSKVPILT